MNVKLQKIQKTFFTLLALVCLCVMLPIHAHASSGKISFNDPSATVGDNVTVTMKVSGTALAGAEIYLTYDTSLLEYVSSSGMTASGGSGSVKILWYDDTMEGVSSVSCSITFKTLASGTASVKVTSAEVYDADEVSVSFSSYGSSSVTISAPVTASSEARLASLSINGTLSPSFSSDTYEYTTKVSNDVSKLVVSLSTKDSDATYSVSGTSLSVGKNTVTIKVTAPDGSTTKKYTITVTRAEATNTQETVVETSEPEEEEVVETPLYIDVSGVQMLAATSLSGIELPEGFAATTCALEDGTAAAAENESNALLLLYLTDENGENGAWYVYDAETGEVYLYIPVTGAAQHLVVVPLSDDTLLPEGFTDTTITIGDYEVTAWYATLDGAETEFFLVWAMNAQGETAFYRYDATDGTFQRYVRETLEEVEEEVAEEAVVEDVPEETDQADELVALQEELTTAQNQLDEKEQLIKILILVIAAVCLLFLVILIFVIQHKKNVQTTAAEVAAAETAPKRVAETNAPVASAAAPEPVDNSYDDISLDDISLDGIDWDDFLS